MKVFVFCVVIAVALAGVFADDEKVVDEFDFDALLNNPEKWKSALACLTGRKPCGELEKLKEGTLKRLATQCADCNPEQHSHYEHVLSLVKDKYPEDYEKIQQLMKKE